MSKVIKDAKTGRFVDKARAEKSPETTITQKRVRFTSAMIARIIASAQPMTTTPITASSAQAVIRAYRQVTRNK
jgi:hypothetical protein